MISLKKQKILTIIFSVFTVVTVLFLPLYSQAGGLVPCGGIGQNPCTIVDVFTEIAIVTNWLIGVAGIYAVYKIIDGGFWLIVSRGNEEQITTHREEITDAVVGFVLVLMAFMLINTVVNLLLTRSIVTQNPGLKCSLDLTKPMSYLSINQNPCTNLPEPQIHY